MSDPILSLRGLSVGYLDDPIVKDFSLDIPRQTIWSLLGGNGAGKSTLLKSLFGLTKWFGGEIHFDGHQIQKASPAERMRAGIGIVPQGRCNFARMSVRENLEMGAYTLARHEKAAAQDRVISLFPVLGRKLTSLAGNLSGGEQQLLETAMVLETNPRLLLLDEPSLGLSPKAQQDVFENVARLRDTGVTVIMAEQNVVGSLLVSDSAVVLDLGTKLIEGPARDVMNDPKIQVAFLGADPTGVDENIQLRMKAVQ